MLMVRIEYLGKIVFRGKKPELKAILDSLAEILRQNIVRKPVIVNENNVVKQTNENIKLYWALRILGVSYIPISTVDTEIRIPLEDLGLFDNIELNPYKVFNNTLELLYRNWPTPLVKLNSLSSNDIRVWAKLEGFNPYSGSIKDRIGWYMFIKSVEEEVTKDKKILYEATSTNTGMALAAMAAIHGFKAKLYLPASIQKVSDTLLRVLGAEVIRKPKTLTVEFVDEVDNDAKRDNALHLNQFENDYNFEVHLKYTAKEIEIQCRKAGFYPKAIIGGIGTSGHMSAIAFYFKNRFKGYTKIYCIQPAQGHVIPGIRRIETGMKWIHLVEVDDIIDVERDEAIGEAINIARHEGILVGLSSGAVVAGFRKLVDKGIIGEGDYVLVFPDHGFKYFEQFEEYFNKHGY